MSGYFTVKSKLKLSEMNVGDKIETSDYAQITPEGFFVQLEYKDENEERSTDVKPGVFTIQKAMTGMYLEKTSFVTDRILPDLMNTKEITDKVDAFFRNVHIYKEYGFEVAKRAALVYGPAGTGKTTSLMRVSENYASDGKTLVLTWPTDKFESYEVKDFIKSFNYVGVEKMIFLIEDLGGVEMDNVRMKSDSSLLSLLDNQEKTFKIPVFILATTNFPANFLGNLTNRPQRFDDKIEVPLPDGVTRAKLLSFFSKDKADQKCLDYITSKKGEEFTPAHLKDAVIRSAIYEKPLIEMLEAIYKEVETYKKEFTKRAGSFGLTA